MLLTNTLLKEVITMETDQEEKVFEITVHGRGGQGAVTAAELLCDFAHAEGFKDVLSIPIIGAERRGAAIKAFTKLSPTKEIKNYSAVISPDVSIIFDLSLLPLPGVLDSIKSGVVICNTHEKLDRTKFLPSVRVFCVDATGISIKLGLVIAGSPVLNVPMLGAYAKVMGHIKLASMQRILLDRFGSKGELNYQAAEQAFNSVHEVN
jgi:2-oxoacid:acceptor oxidoreductase gamma subunit (pyruvate/2-ketoisovalerate family)